MRFLDLIQKAFDKVVKSPAMTLQLVIYLIVINFLTPYVFISEHKSVAIILICCIFLFSTAFISGWFQVVKEFTKKDLMGEFKIPILLEGIGKNFLSTLIASLIYLGFLALSLYLTSLVAQLLFGNMNFLVQDLKTIPQNPSAYFEYIKNLPVDKLYIIYGWQVCFIISSAIFNFLFMFYFPTLISDTTKCQFLRPFKAFYKSLCFTFKNFFMSLGLYLFIHIIYISLGIFRAVLMSFIGKVAALGAVISMIYLVAYIYFICFVVMLLFYYYEEKNSCSNGSDCIGQNENGDIISKED